MCGFQQLGVTTSQVDDSEDLGIVEDVSSDGSAVPS